MPALRAVGSIGASPRRSWERKWRTGSLPLALPPLPCAATSQIKFCYIFITSPFLLWSPVPLCGCQELWSFLSMILPLLGSSPSIFSSLSELIWKCIFCLCVRFGSGGRPFLVEVNGALCLLALWCLRLSSPCLSESELRFHFILLYKLYFEYFSLLLGAVAYGQKVFREIVVCLNIFSLAGPFSLLIYY